MNFTHEDNGDLTIEAGVLEREDIAQYRRNCTSEIQAEDAFILDYFHDEVRDVEYEPIRPEEVGALTSAPLITDGENVWGFMRYQVENFLEELVAGRPTLWTRG